MLYSHFLKRILPHNFLIVNFFCKKYLKLKLSKLYAAYLNMKRNKTAYMLVAGLTKKLGTDMRIDIKKFYVNEDSKLNQEESQQKVL